LEELEATKCKICDKLEKMETIFDLTTPSKLECRPMDLKAYFGISPTPMTCNLHSYLL